MFKKESLILLLAGGVCLLALSGIFVRSVKIWVFDVGQGDAIFIDGREQILIDGGPDGLVVERLSTVLPWWDRTIKYVMNTHPHADHVIGLLPVLERYRVGEAIDAEAGYATVEFAEYTELVAERHRLVSAGDVIDLGDEARLTVLWPPVPYEGEALEDPNDGSIIALFEYGDFSLLLTGDAGEAEELAVLEAAKNCVSSGCLGDIDVLKVGHHGSDTSTSAAWLDALTPEVAIISAGVDNSYNHPSTFILDRLQNRNIRTFRTDTQGSIKIKIRGGDYRVSTHAF